jgi:hypothetical protein
MWREETRGGTKAKFETKEKDVNVGNNEELVIIFVIPRPDTYPNRA